MQLLQSEMCNSVGEVFRTQFSLEARTLGVTAATESAPGSCAVGVINLVGPSVAGSLILWMPKDSFCKFLNVIFSESHTDVSAANADAVAEFLNMSYGVARPKINQKGHSLQPAIPSVIWGSDVSVSLNAYEDKACLPFTCMDLPFNVLIGLKKAA